MAEGGAVFCPSMLFIFSFDAVYSLRIWLFEILKSSNSPSLRLHWEGPGEKNSIRKSDNTLFNILKCCSSSGTSCWVSINHFIKRCFLHGVILIKLKKTIKNSLVKGIIVNPVRTLLSPTDLITYGHLCEETQEKF